MATAFLMPDTEPNELDRQFTVIRPKEAWCSDMTYVGMGKH